MAEPWALTSRYNDRYVQSHFDAVDMTGPAGGGFVFDTNSLHRCVVIGNRPRKTVILEFHGHGKLPRAGPAQRLPLGKAQSVAGRHTDLQIISARINMTNHLAGAPSVALCANGRSGLRAASPSLGCSRTHVPRRGVSVPARMSQRQPVDVHAAGQTTD